MNLDELEEYKEEKDFTEIYVGREDLDEMFLNEISSIRREIESSTRNVECHVINDFGIGGIGKSYIEKHFIEIIKQEQEKGKIEYIIFDFEKEKKSDRQIIEDFMGKMSERYIDDFYCTACAIIKLCKEEGNPYKGTVNTSLEDCLNNKFVQIMTYLLNQIPLIGKVFGAAKDINNILANPDERSLDDMMKILEEKAENVSKTSATCVRDIRIKNIEKNKLEEKLVEYLARDLRVIMMREKKPLIIFIDAYENQINTFSEISSSLISKEKWLKELINKVPYVLWVVSGREKLEITDVAENEWSEIKHSSNEIPYFNENEIKSYMTKVDVDLELLPLFSRLSGGVPYLLDILCKSYGNLLEKEGKDAALNENNYGINKSDVPNRYLKRLENDTDTEKILKQLAIIEGGWSKEILKEDVGVIEKFDKDKYRNLIKSSFIKYFPENEKYSIPEAIRSVLLENTDDEEKIEMYHRLSSYYEKLVREEVYEELKNVKQLLRYSTPKEKEQFFYELIDPRICFLGDINKLEEAKQIIEEYRDTFINTSDKKFRYRFLTLDGKLNYRKGDYEKALINFIECKEIGNELGSKDSSYLFDALINIAECLEAEGDYPGAWEEYSECYNMYEEYLVDERHGFYILNKMAQFMMNKYNNSDLAFQLFKLCYEAGEDILQDDPVIITPILGMAECMLNMQDIATAYEYYKKGYERSKQLCPENHLKIYEALTGMAICKTHTDKNEAYKLFKECYEICEQNLHRSHPNTFESMMNMALCMKDMDKVQEAYNLLKKCYEKEKQELPENHEVIFQTMINLGVCAKEIGNNSEAFYLYKECYEKSSMILPKTNQIVLVSMYNYAKYLLSYDQINAALELFQDCYERRRQVFSANHPDVIATLYQITKCQDKLADYEPLFLFDDFDDVDDFDNQNEDPVEF